MIEFLDYKDKKTTTISGVTKLDGDLKIAGNLEFYGSINGNITSDSLAIISGFVNGDVKARDVLIKQGCYIDGNIETDLDVVVEAGSTITKNIHSNTIEISGLVYGNLDSDDLVIIHKGGVVKGDVYCRNITVDNGGKLEGIVDFKYYLA